MKCMKSQLVELLNVSDFDTHQNESILTKELVLFSEALYFLGPKGGRIKSSSFYAPCIPSYAFSSYIFVTTVSTTLKIKVLQDTHDAFNK